MRLDVQYTQAAGTTFAWSSIGPTHRAGNAVALIMGGTGSPMAEWDPAFLDSLADYMQVVVFDYPGLGLSGPAPGRITFPAMADWVADFIDETDLDQPDILGWSMGGFVAQQLVIRHPDKVGDLVLAGTNPGGKHAVLGPEWVQEADSDAGGSIASYLATNYPPTKQAQKAGRDFIRRLTSAVNSGRYPDESTPTSTYNAMVRAEDPWLKSDANYNALKGIKARTLVITGRDDVITPPANSGAIAKQIPNSTLQLVPGAGHSFLFQYPSKVAKTVVDFLLSD